MTEGSEGSSHAQLEGGGYEEHIKNRQHIWDYMYFLFYLWSKHSTEYTGPEKTIKQLTVTNDIRWLPVGRSTIKELAEQAGAQLGSASGNEASQDGGGSVGEISGYIEP